ncbi:ABC transporter substrate-binding protein [Fictibacillus sp. KIGAM418]|uniref:ABC transporter substrate-binding protein n=1 Tax=Fictibacillus marinisediminis TaxID=2878389 RepID=A0A9X1X8N5_9BACL|nr:ABC transporter substrate-binding protein [Fictibacillus marinisediminis]MCK6256192.1 ABC transporter substrate-binding protein [Fictibacillus marinisediminis]
MKRLSLIFLVVFSMLLSACALNSSGDNESKDSGEKASTSAVKDAKGKSYKATDVSALPDKAKARKDTFIAGISAPGGVFLPYFYENGWDGNATTPIFAPLVDLDKDGKPVPILAESWETSKDQLTYTFHIRKNAKFSDGSPVTANDVAFTLKLLHDPAYNGYQDISLAAIKGGKEYKEGKAKTIEGIKAKDPQTIEITTDKVNAKALLILGGQVLSEKYYGKDYKYGKLDYLKDLYSKPLGAGPYVFSKYVPGQEIRYTANDKYYAGKPKTKNLIYKIIDKATSLQQFETGELDYAGFPADDDTVEQLKSLKFANIKVEPVNDYGLIYVNNTRPQFKDKEVRQALLYGLDRQKIVDVRFKGFGQVADIPVSPVSWAYNNQGVTEYKFDPKKAKKLLDKAGWKTGKSGIREKNGVQLKINYLTSDAEDAVIPIAKENYQDIGVKFEPDITDFNALVSKLTKKNYDFAAVSTSQILDPSDTVEELATKNPNNYMGYSNAKIDKLIQEGLGTLDITKRKEVYHELYKEFTQDPPYILIHYRQSARAISGQIEGLVPDNYTGIGSSLPNISIKK